MWRCNIAHIIYGHCALLRCMLCTNRYLSHKTMPAAYFGSSQLTSPMSKTTDYCNQNLYPRKYVANVVVPWRNALKVFFISTPSFTRLYVFTCRAQWYSHSMTAVWVITCLSYTHDSHWDIQPCIRAAHHYCILGWAVIINGDGRCEW